MSKATILAASALSIALGGCVSLLPKAAPAPALFRVTLAPAAGAQKAGAALVAVAAPDAPDLLGGTDLIYVADARWTAIAGAAWAIPAREMLQSALVDAVDRESAVKAAFRLETGARADVEIAWRLVDFEIERVDSRLVAHVQASATLIDTLSRKVIAQTRTDIRVPDNAAAGSAPEAAAQLLETAARQAIGELAAFAAAHSAR